MLTDTDVWKPRQLPDELALNGMSLLKRIRVQSKRLLGALRSGEEKSRLAIALRALGPIARTVDALWYHATHAAHDQASTPCLMIVGPPRSGSTLIYQTLVRALPCAYLSNLHLLFPRHASRYLFRRGANNTLTPTISNYYGYTGSLKDVSEANEIVGSLFAGNPSIDAINRRFHTLHAAACAGSNRPFIFKNVRAYAKLSELHDSVPHLLFLRVRRDPEEVVRSVLSAYHELGTFHPVPETLRGHSMDDPVKFAVLQILHIERAIDSQKQIINRDRWLEWEYEAFCREPWPLIADLAENYLHIDPSHIRQSDLPLSFQPSQRVKLSATATARISDLLRSYSTLDQLPR